MITIFGVLEDFCYCSNSDFDISGSCHNSEFALAVLHSTNFSKSTDMFRCCFSLSMSKFLSVSTNDIPTTASESATEGELGRQAIVDFNGTFSLARVLLYYNKNNLMLCGMHTSHANLKHNSEFILIICADISIDVENKKYLKTGHY